MISVMFIKNEANPEYQLNETMKSTTSANKMIKNDEKPHHHNNKYKQNVLKNIPGKKRNFNAPLTEFPNINLDDIGRVNIHSSFLELQRTHGNQYVQKVAKIRTKLNISQPGDVYEQEADQIAEKIMKMATPGQVQRKCPEDKNCLLEDEKKKNTSIQLKTGGSAKNELSVPSNIISALGPGQPLDNKTKDFMEPRFGHDFSNVRIHTDSNAGKSAQAINALAFTIGHNIVFDGGKNSPETISGLKLLAHELTHVVQQHHETIPRKDAGIVQPESDKGVSTKGSTTKENIQALKINIIPDSVKWAEPKNNRDCTDTFTGGGYFRPHGVAGIDKFLALPIISFNQTENLIKIQEIIINTIIDLHEPIEDAYPQYSSKDPCDNNVRACKKLGIRDMSTNSGHWEDVNKNMGIYGENMNMNKMKWWVRGSTLYHENVHLRLYKERFEQDWNGVKERWVATILQEIDKHGLISKEENVNTQMEKARKILATMTYFVTSDSIAYQETKNSCWEKEINRIKSFFEAKPDDCSFVEQCQHGSRQKAPVPVKRSSETPEKEEDPNDWAR